MTFRNILFQILEDGGNTRSLTLEEVTDTILFCSSIIHDLAYQAATIAMEKEHSEPLEGSEPTVTILAKTNSDTKDSQQPNCWQGCMKPQKEARLRMMKILISLTPNVGLPNKVDNMKPLPNKLESKCNCIIM